MSKTLSAGIGLALLIALLADPAQAWSMKTRSDPDDHEARTDIRRVRSDLTASSLFLEIASWQQVRTRLIAYSHLARHAWNVEVRSRDPHQPRNRHTEVHRVVRGDGPHDRDAIRATFQPSDR